MSACWRILRPGAVLGAVLDLTPSLSPNPFIRQHRVCPLSSCLKSWEGEGGSGRGLFFVEHEGLSVDLQKTNPSPPLRTPFFRSAWMRLLEFNWFAQTKAAIRRVSDYTQGCISKTTKKIKKKHSLLLYNFINIWNLQFRKFQILEGII